MENAHFHFRCRMCGETYVSVSTSEDLIRRKALEMLWDAITGAVGITLALTPTLVEVHICSDLSLGVADLLGCTIEDNQTIKQDKEGEGVPPKESFRVD